MYLFREEIRDWPSWGGVFQSLPAFRKLIEDIFNRERLAGANRISNLTPGTNAVFKVGDYVVKLFAPAESGLDTEHDYETELRATRRASNRAFLPRVWSRRPVSGTNMNFGM